MVDPVMNPRDSNRHHNDNTEKASLPVSASGFHPGCSCEFDTASRLVAQPGPLPMSYYPYADQDEPSPTLVLLPLCREAFLFAGPTKSRTMVLQ